MTRRRCGQREEVESRPRSQSNLDRSEILRDALHRHLVALSAEHDADTWERLPLDEAERSLSAISDWGPAEDWADWHDAAR